MIRLPMLVLGLLFTYSLIGQNLDKHQWKHRILIVTTHDEDCPEYQQQIAQFENAKSEMRDRRMILYKVVGDKYKILDYQTSKDTEEWQHLNDTNEHRPHDDDKFSLTLIGLDGGVKLRSTEVLSAKEIYNIIDAMPMRASELRGRKNEDWN